MDNTSANWGYWGAGCLLDIVVFLVAVALLDTNAGASFLFYMLMLAIPMGLVRFFFFSDTTPRWLRVCLGPVGAIACLVLAATVPLDLSSEEQADQEPSKQAEAPKGNGGESAAPKESVEDVLAELDSLVGLEGVKAEVKRIVNLAKVNEARRVPRTRHRKGRAARRDRPLWSCRALCGRDGRKDEREGRRGDWRHPFRRRGVPACE